MTPAPLVQTIKERCRTCFTCVRECPAKAIRVADGQAEVLVERCIGCGNCLRVCSQNAKKVRDGIDDVRRLLKSGARVAACLAPSFPAEFTDCTPQQLVGMLRALGFASVHEVAFGADLVADRYRQLLEANGTHRHIASTCPGVVAYVEQYHPGLVGNLAPIVSPMVAISRVLRRIHGPQIVVVFIGPCIAKKNESLNHPLDGDVNAALTFEELRAMLTADGIKPQDAAPAEMDGPAANLGGLFSVSRGLLQTAHIQEDLLAGDVVATDGRVSFVSAIREFDEGHLDARLLEVLCCQGCVSGAGMSATTPLFRRRKQIVEYVRTRMKTLDLARWQRDVEGFHDLDLSRTFEADDQRIPVPFAEELEMIMVRMGKRTPQDELNCGACGYDTCREHAVAIFRGLAETAMCLPNTISKLDQTIKELNESNRRLTSTQEALMQSEKLASMGRLAAGIAHEVNNPLGVVLMYAHLVLDELKPPSPLRQDLAMIAEQADRCKKIVAQLLHFARQNKLEVSTADMRSLVERALMSAPPPAGIEVRLRHSGQRPTADVDASQIIQVLTNLITNAYAAMGQQGALTIRTEADEEFVRLIVEDTGVGIPPENFAKIFEPFFTTKQIGQGTGLGLAVTYGIVKMHRGDITVQSDADPAAGPTGSTFTVKLPRQAQTEN